MLGQAKQKPGLLIGFLLTLTVLMAYLPVLQADFTNYDDPYYVTENAPVLAGLTRAGVRWALTDTHTGNWHPVTWLSHMADCQLFGLNAGGHHLTSLIFHAANSILLFCLLCSLTSALWPSAFVAALFALHPLHVESVAWVSERKDVLSAFFGLLCLWAYGRYAKGQPRGGERAATQYSIFTFGRFASGYYGLALVLFTLGLMSKPMLVTWPFVMLLLDYWPLRRVTNDPWSKLIFEKLPFFALSAGFCVITLWAQKAGGAIATLDSIPLGSRVLNALVSYFRYLSKLIWPIDLAVIYPLGPNWPLSRVLGAGLVLITVTLLVLWQRRQRPYLLTGWTWYVGTLVPVVGLVQVGNQAMADRYAYLPAIGLFLIAGWGAAELVGTFSRRPALVGAIATALLAVCAIRAHSQAKYWRNTEELFRHAVAVTSNNFIAYNSLGFYYADRGQVEKAKDSFRAAVAINPASYVAWNKLAEIVIEEGKFEEAIADCEAALRTNPHMPEAQGTLGRALMKQGRVEEAISHYLEALRLRPDSASLHYNLANARTHQGQFKKAREHYQEALRLAPQSADAHNNLAYLLAREGEFEQAILEFRSALALQPGLWQARYGLGIALDKIGKHEEAARESAEVRKAHPELFRQDLHD